MKITGNLPPELGLAAAQAAGQGQEARGAAGAGSPLQTAVLPQVELLTDAGIRMLLGELTKLLDNQASLQGQLPPTVAAAAESALAGQAADSVLPQGLAALVKGARSGADSMGNLAGRLKAAASLARVFPAGVPAALTELATAVAAGMSAEPQAAMPAAMPAGQATQIPAGQNASAGQAALPQPPGPQAGTATLSAPATAGQPATMPAGGQLAAAPAGQAPIVAEAAAGNAANGPVQTTSSGAQVPAAATGAGLPGKVAATAAEVLTALTGELAKAASGQATETPALARLQQVLVEVLPDKPSLPVRAALNQATAALDAYLPATGGREAPGPELKGVKEGLVLLTVADSQKWLKLPENSLRQAAATLHELAAAPPGQQAADTAGSQNVLAMTVPLYLGPDGKAYPAYIHISQEKENGGRPADGRTVRDTWLRVCLATENIGLVDIVFHVWGDMQLSIRAVFSEPEAVEDFRRMVPDIRQEMASSPLTLTDISVVTTQAR
jgi:hypothetical protein